MSAICTSSLEEGLFMSSAYLLIGVFVGGVLVLSCRSSLYILGINPLLAISFANIFCHSVGGLLVLLIVSSAVQSFLF